MNDPEKEVHVKANRHAKPYTGDEPRFQRVQLESVRRYLHQPHGNMRHREVHVTRRGED